MEHLGFIGLGVMGRPMAANLLRGGYLVSAFSRTLPDVPTPDGMQLCESAAAVAQRSSIVFLMVPDTPDVEAVLFGEHGVGSKLKAGALVVDMSSISPAHTRVFAERIRRMGADYLDAPVSGGEVGAQAGTLSIMVGGSSDSFARALPYFQLMGKNINHVGACGAGQVCKIANQVIVGLTIEAVAEALLLASKCGVDPARVRDALMGGFAASRVLEVHGERMIKRSFAPGFRIALHQKDLGLALTSAREVGLAMPNTANTAQLLQVCAAHGLEQQDHSALCRALEMLADREIA
jgi:2-hydroxy-3-oxopropionate reductase